MPRFDLCSPSRASRPGLTRRLLPPLAFACVAAMGLLRPAGEVVAQQLEEEPLTEVDICCERMTVEFLMVGWMIYGTCEYRYCQFIDEDGYVWKFGGVPLTFIESDCGPLGTHAPDNDTPGAS